MRSVRGSRPGSPPRYGADVPEFDKPFKDWVVAQLAAFPNLACRPMFGGYGLSASARDPLCGILFQGRLYLKTDARSRIPFERLGMGKFDFPALEPTGSFYECPRRVLEDKDLLGTWFRQAAAVAAARP